jgi:hypothetical protein
MGISILPGLITDMQEAILMQSNGTGHFVAGKAPYLVISGVFTDESRIAEIIRTIMKRDETNSIKILLLCREKPSTQFKYNFKSSKYKNRILFFNGSGYDANDLKRVQLRCLLIN